MPERRVACVTLGCKVNQYDTEAMLGLFRRAGYLVVPFEEKADVYIVNTCTVTGRGASKSRQIIRQAVRRNPGAVVVVAGCYPQTAAEEVMAIPGVSVALGTQDRDRVVELVEQTRHSGPVNAVTDIREAGNFEETPVEEFSGRTRAPVKVQEGCGCYCTYCIIPFARGPVRSRLPESVRAEVCRLTGAGFREVVLTGIHLGSYGPPPLDELVRGLLDIPGLVRIRLSSLEPRHVRPGLIDLMAGDPKVCRHLHLSLQSGSEQVLRRMGRRYSAAEYREKVAEIRRRIPEIGLTTDVMVGFPGETDAEFAESLDFVREIGFSRLHVFPYSPRAGTPAAGFPGQIPNRVKEERAAQMIKLGREISREYHLRLVGRQVEVLAEAEDEGYTDTYVRVEFSRLAGLDPINRLVRVRVTGAASEGVSGQLLKTEGINREVRE